MAIRYVFKLQMVEVSRFDRFKMRRDTSISHFRLLDAV